MIRIETPLSSKTVSELKVGDTIEISGFIYAGRDAALPKLVKLIQMEKADEMGIDLKGSAIFHTAVSPAGVGPTSSNKSEIESSIPALSEAGVKLHLGKGALSKETLEELKRHNSVYAVIPPVTALLTSKIIHRSVAAFPEEGMEALWLLKVDHFPAIIAAAGGESLY